MTVDMVADRAVNPAPDDGVRAGGPDENPATNDPGRLQASMTAHFNFVVRSLRRVGYDIADAEDAAQEAFLVLARRLGDVVQERERPFLFSSAMRIASAHRRGLHREWQRSASSGAEVQPIPSPLEVSEHRSARQKLDEVLSELSVDLRTVLVLYELEEMNTQEIADLLDLPAGTVASRLRRARDAFREGALRVQARDAFRGGTS
jgi:RNA polymerase sigma-70 factor (ECF subfamily)